MIYKHFLKLIFDYFASFFLIIFLSPIFIIVFALVFFIYRQNPIFIQKRLGYNGKIISVLKFRTIYKNILLEKQLKTTKFGKFLRDYSIDELPQLVNIIKNEMSLVGPRPLTEEDSKINNEIQSDRLSVKPGITGWAQINGRNNLSKRDKFYYDLWYINNISFFLDLKIIILTIIKVFKSEGIEY